MKGYCYMDLDGGLHVREKHFIDIECPQFWQQNAYMISLVWEFDTDNMESVINMCRRFTSLKLKSQDVILLLQSIGLTKEDLKNYASSIHTGQNQDPIPA